MQWTTGIVGSSALRNMVIHPDLEVVGCYAHSPEKVGVDAGELCGIDPIGVVATDSIDDIISLAPDCVVYMPQWPQVAEIEQLLGAGINVVTTARLVTGRYYGDDAGDRLERAAKSGGVSLHGTGMNPMFVPTIALAATAMCREVRKLTILESVDCLPYGAAGTWEAYGFGTPVDDPNLKDNLWRAEPGYREVLDILAHSLGVELDDMTMEAEFAAAREDRDLGFMKIPEGTVAALKACWSGLVGGEPFVQLHMMWKLGGLLGYTEEPDWPVLYGYKLEVEGEPNVKVDFMFMPEDIGTMDIGIPTAMPAVNSIITVCDAPPGVVTLSDMPMITGRGLPRSRDPQHLV